MPKFSNSIDDASRAYEMLNQEVRRASQQFVVQKQQLGSVSALNLKVANTVNQLIQKWQTGAKVSKELSSEYRRQMDALKEMERVQKKTEQALRHLDFASKSYTGQLGTMIGGMTKASGAFSGNLKALTGLGLGYAHLVDTMKTFNRTMFETARIGGMMGESVSSISSQFDRIRVSTNLSKQGFAELNLAFKQFYLGVPPSTKAVADLAEAFTGKLGYAEDEIISKTKDLISLQQRLPSLFQDIQRATEAYSNGLASGEQATAKLQMRMMALGHSQSDIINVMKAIRPVDPGTAKFMEFEKSISKSKQTLKDANLEIANKTQPLLKGIATTSATAAQSVAGLSKSFLNLTGAMMAFNAVGGMNVFPALMSGGAFLKNSQLMGNTKSSLTKNPLGTLMSSTASSGGGIVKERAIIKNVPRSISFGDTALSKMSRSVKAGAKAGTMSGVKNSLGSLKNLFKRGAAGVAGTGLNVASTAVVAAGGLATGWAIGQAINRAMVGHYERVGSTEEGRKSLRDRRIDAMPGDSFGGLFYGKLLAVLQERKMGNKEAGSEFLKGTVSGFFKAGGPLTGPVGLAGAWHGGMQSKGFYDGPGYEGVNNSKTMRGILSRGKKSGEIRSSEEFVAELKKTNSSFKAVYHELKDIKGEGSQIQINELVEKTRHEQVKGTGSIVAGEAVKDKTKEKYLLEMINAGLVSQETLEKGINLVLKDETKSRKKALDFIKKAGKSQTGLKLGVTALNTELGKSLVSFGNLVTVSDKFNAGMPTVYKELAEQGLSTTGLDKVWDVKIRIQRDLYKDSEKLMGEAFVAGMANLSTPESLLTMFKLLGESVSTEAADKLLSKSKEHEEIELKIVALKAKGADIEDKISNSSGSKKENYQDDKKKIDKEIVKLGESAKVVMNNFSGQMVDLSKFNSIEEVAASIYAKDKEITDELKKQLVEAEKIDKAMGNTNATKKNRAERDDITGIMSSMSEVGATQQKASRDATEAALSRATLKYKEEIVLGEKILSLSESKSTVAKEYRLGMGTDYALLQEQVSKVNQLIGVYDQLKVAIPKEEAKHLFSTFDSVDSMKEAEMLVDIAIRDPDSVKKKVGEMVKEGSIDAKDRQLIETSLLDTYEKQKVAMVDQNALMLKKARLTKDIREGYLDAFQEMVVNAGAFSDIIAMQGTANTQLLKYGANPAFGIGATSSKTPEGYTGKSVSHQVALGGGIATEDGKVGFSNTGTGTLVSESNLNSGYGVAPENSKDVNKDVRNFFRKKPGLTASDGPNRTDFMDAAQEDFVNNSSSRPNSSSTSIISRVPGRSGGGGITSENTARQLNPDYTSPTDEGSVGGDGTSAVIDTFSASPKSKPKPLSEGDVSFPSSRSAPNPPTGAAGRTPEEVVHIQLNAGGVVPSGSFVVKSDMTSAYRGDLEAMGAHFFSHGGGIPGMDSIPIQTEGGPAIVAPGEALVSPDMAMFAEMMNAGTYANGGAIPRGGSRGQALPREGRWGAPEPVSRGGRFGPVLPREGRWGPPPPVSRGGRGHLGRVVDAREQEPSAYKSGLEKLVNPSHFSEKKRDSIAQMKYDRRHKMDSIDEMKFNKAFEKPKLDSIAQMKADRKAENRQEIAPGIFISEKRYEDADGAYFDKLHKTIDFHEAKKTAKERRVSAIQSKKKKMQLDYFLNTKEGAKLTATEYNWKNNESPITAKFVVDNQDNISDDILESLITRKKKDEANKKNNNWGQDSKLSVEERKRNLNNRMISSSPLFYQALAEQGITQASSKGKSSLELAGLVNGNVPTRLAESRQALTQTYRSETPSSNQKVKSTSWSRQDLLAEAMISNPKLADEFKSKMISNRVESEYRNKYREVNGKDLPPDPDPSMLNKPRILELRKKAAITTSKVLSTSTSKYKEKVQYRKQEVKRRKEQEELAKQKAIAEKEYQSLPLPVKFRMWEEGKRDMSEADKKQYRKVLEIGEEYNKSRTEKLRTRAYEEKRGMFSRLGRSAIAEEASSVYLSFASPFLTATTLGRANKGLDKLVGEGKGGLSRLVAEADAENADRMRRLGKSEGSIKFQTYAPKVLGAVSGMAVGNRGLSRLSSASKSGYLTRGQGSSKQAAAFFKSANAGHGNLLRSGAFKTRYAQDLTMIRPGGQLAKKTIAIAAGAKPASSGKSLLQRKPGVSKEALMKARHTPNQKIIYDKPLRGITKGVSKPGNTIQQTASKVSSKARPFQDTRLTSGHVNRISSSGVKPATSAVNKASKIVPKTKSASKWQWGSGQGPQNPNPKYSPKDYTRLAKAKDGSYWPTDTRGLAEPKVDLTEIINNPGKKWFAAKDSFGFKANNNPWRQLSLKTHPRTSQGSALDRLTTGTIHVPVEHSGRAMSHSGLFDRSKAKFIPRYQGLPIQSPPPGLTLKSGGFIGARGIPRFRSGGFVGGGPIRGSSKSVSKMSGIKIATRAFSGEDQNTGIMVPRAMQDPTTSAGVTAGGGMSTQLKLNPEIADLLKLERSVPRYGTSV